jgi:sensor histidine kinase YesM
MRESRSTLGRELALTTAYLNVQKMRMETRLDFGIDVPERLLAIVVPPMMLATLVENAVIHGLSPLPAGGRIEISAEEHAGKLLVRVTDNGRGLKDTWGAGVGLSNIRARLQSAFGNTACLRLAAGDERGVVATLEIPMTAEAATA